jgi:hypothetical protein
MYWQWGAINHLMTSPTVSSNPPYLYKPTLAKSRACFAFALIQSRPRANCTLDACSEAKISSHSRHFHCTRWSMKLDVGEQELPWRATSLFLGGWLWRIEGLGACVGTCFYSRCCRTFAHVGCRLLGLGVRSGGSVRRGLGERCSINNFAGGMQRDL